MTVAETTPTDTTIMNFGDQRAWSGSVICTTDGIYFQTSLDYINGAVYSPLTQPSALSTAQEPSIHVNAKLTTEDTGASSHGWVHMETATGSTYWVLAWGK